MKHLLILIAIVLTISACNKQSKYQVISKVPNLTIKENGLKFSEIEDYKNYKIVATHFRTDKNELRYVLANAIAYKPFIDHQELPEGSKIVKIGWKVKEMSKFPVALESDKIQRIEYMIKDAKKFKNNPGNWGYARFIKDQDKYKSWDKGTESCISCHNLAKDNNFLFSSYQKLF